MPRDIYERNAAAFLPCRHTMDGWYIFSGWIWICIRPCMGCSVYPHIHSQVAKFFSNVEWMEDVCIWMRWNIKLWCILMKRGLLVGDRPTVRPAGCSSFAQEENCRMWMRKGNAYSILHIRVYNRQYTRTLVIVNCVLYLCNIYRMSVYLFVSSSM